MNFFTFGILVTVSSPLVETTTYHWRVIPERLAINAPVTIEFWLEDFQTTPDGGVGNLTIYQFNYYQDRNDTIFQLDGEQCQTSPVTWPTMWRREDTPVTPVLCDRTMGKFSFRLEKLMIGTRFFANASNQDPDVGYSGWIRPYEVLMDLLYYARTDSVNVGDDVQMICTGNTYFAYFSLKHVNDTKPIPLNTKWRRNSRGWDPPLVGDDHPANYGVETIVTFTARRGDDGWYQCQAVFEPGSGEIFTSRPLYLNVAYAPALNINAEHTDQIEADLGEEITFSLPILANPLATAVWMKGSQQLRNDQKFIIVDEKTNNGQYFRLSFVVGKGDFSMYKCIVASDLGQPTFYFHLNQKLADGSNSIPNTTIIALLIVIVIIIIVVIVVFSVFIAVLIRRVKPTETNGQQVTNVTYQANEDFRQEENTYENPYMEPTMTNEHI